MDEVFVISEIIKVEESVISLNLTETLIISDIKKNESDNCFIIHRFKENNDRHIIAPSTVYFRQAMFLLRCPWTWHCSWKLCIVRTTYRFTTYRIKSKCSWFSEFHSNKKSDCINPGSFAVQFGDHLRAGIICRPVDTKISDKSVSENKTVQNF